MAMPKTIVITTLAKRAQPFHITDDISDSDGGGPRKRRRLTHLSTDEKLLRRKLKNRVAAQTARDRKKALMDELEEQVAKLQKDKEQLLKENAQLRLKQAIFQEENLQLKRLNASSSTPQAVTASSPCLKEGADASALPCETEPAYPGSAAPAVSLPKEQIQVLSCVAARLSRALTFSLMTLCLIGWNKSVPSGAKMSPHHSSPLLIPALPAVETLGCPMTQTCVLSARGKGLPSPTWLPSIR